MLKWWSDVYKDLKPFDTLSIEGIFDRAQAALRFINEDEYNKQAAEGRPFIGIRSSDLSDPDVKYFHGKYNHPSCTLPCTRQIVLRQYHPEYSRPEYETEENKHVFGGLSSNVNNRDGFIVSGLSTKSIEGDYLIPKRKGVITGEYIFLILPHSLVYDHMDLSINGAPLSKVRDFITEIDNTVGWEDLEEVKKRVSYYDEHFPNWNHDFPIKTFMQLKKDGLLFPPTWLQPFSILTEGTHRIITTGYNKYDIPFIIPIPSLVPTRWFVQSKSKMFNVEGTYKYLCAEIDRAENTVKYSFSENIKWAYLNNIQLNDKLYEFKRANLL